VGAGGQLGGHPRQVIRPPKLTGWLAGMSTQLPTGAHSAGTFQALSSGFIPASGRCLKPGTFRRCGRRWAAGWTSPPTSPLSPGVRADLHQRRAAELAHHLPGGEAIARRHQATKVFIPASGRCLKPGTFRRCGRRWAAGWTSPPTSPIVEAEKKSFRRKRLKAMMRVQNVLNAHGMVAVMQQ
jgi:hypothetical protein